MIQSATTRIVAGVVSAALLLTLILSVTPHLHEQVHADAKSVEHSCAVTFVAAGTIEQSTSPVIVSAPVFEYAAPSTLSPRWVASLFFGAHIFAHAPPQNS